DRLTRRIMKKVLKGTSNCIDVGAHRGGLLLDMVKLAPHGRIFAFEPLPHLAERLEKRWAAKPNVEVYQLALSDANGSKKFFQVMDSLGKSGFRRMRHTEGSPVREITVQTRRLDDVVDSGMRIDFIKVDVEGAQLEVFAGARRILSNDRPHIVFEHGMLAQESYGTTCDMIYDLLVGECGLEI